MDARKSYFCLQQRLFVADKFALYRLYGGGEELLAQGAVERIGARGARLWISSGSGKSAEIPARISSSRQAGVRALFDGLDRLRLRGPDAVGHRIVHGGPNHARRST